LQIEKYTLLPQNNSSLSHTLETTCQLAINAYV
jgi:hypothetical protein